jgi:hypothetical protein
MTRYLEERDEYRAVDGKSKIWKGANISHSYRMMAKAHKRAGAQGRSSKGGPRQEVALALGQSGQDLLCLWGQISRHQAPPEDLQE